MPVLYSSVLQLLSNSESELRLSIFKQSSDWDDSTENIFDCNFSLSLSKKMFKNFRILNFFSFFFQIEITKYRIDLYCYDIFETI